MPLFGKIIVIKRNGTDGIHFPLTASSCLFGRKTECDIRIQLPQVSKEHCKIEVNENKEAILFNLSTLNPTHLNGNSFQQPVHLKHGDVFTIVDRSFRFEYPPQSTPRKRLSRTPKNETLQVLHVQQVSEVELQSRRSKSPHTSDKNIECESQNFGENDKQSTEEDISRVVPAKHHATPKSAYKTAKSNRRENEMSPFSKLYELLKHEIDEKTQKDGNEKILIPQLAATNAQKNSLVTCSSDQEIQTNEKETIIGEDIEQSKIKEQDQNNVELNHTFAEENGSKSFSESLQTSVSKDKPRDNQNAGHLHLQDSTSTQEHRDLENSEGVKKIKYVTTKLKTENNQSETCSPNTYRMESLECIDKICQAGKPVEQTANVTNKASLTDTSKADKYAVSTPRYKRKSLLAHSSPSMKSNESSATNSSSPLTGQDPSLGMKAAEMSTEIQKKDVACSSVAGNESYVLGENKYAKQKRNSKQLIPRKSLNAEEVLKEIYDDTYSVSITTETDSETVALSPGYNSKSPKGSVRQSKRFSNKSPFSEVFTPERLTPKDESSTTHKYHSEARRGRRTSSGKMSEKILERDQSQNHDKNANIKDSSVKEKLATENYQQKLDVEDANVVLEPPRLSSKRRCSESVALLRDDEVASEMNISSLLTEDKKSGQTKRSPRKRKSGELEILLQPIGKRKRVSFGGHLSPELFDKSLPPNSPLKRGAIPARLSLPFGNSPRAVLKKGQGLKHLLIKDLTEQLQREKSQENLPARRSPAASPPARRSPAASPPARRSPAASPPILKKMSPNPIANSSSTIQFTKGRFSISHISTPSPTSKKGTAATKLNENERVNFTGVRTPESFHINQELQVSVATTPKQLRRRSIRFSAKRTPMKKRSDAVETIHSKRRSGASKANLLVAKSWAEVVKLGVARPQVKAVKKCVLKGRSVKKLTKSPKTPARKIKGHFSTGHADSPATIVIGKAHTSAVNLVGQAPRVVKNYALKQNVDINESFTGMTEMFRTPVNENKKSPSLSAVHKTDFTPSCTEIEVSEVHTPEETGEMVISPLSTSGMSQQRKNSQDAVSRFLRAEKSPNSSFVGVKLKQTPEKERTILEEEVVMSDSLVMPEKHITEVGAKGFEKTPKQKPESDEAFSGVKRLLRTPKQKVEPVEALLGVKRLLRTPKQKAEPVEALSGIKRLMRTPKQKVEPVESLSGVKRLLRTPKQKAEPVESLSGVKRLLRTPKQKAEAVEDLSGIKRLMRTPKQKVEPVESLSGIKRLLRTPKEKAELVEALSDVKRLLSTPEQKKESPIDEITLKKLLKTPAQKEQVVNDLVGVSFMKTTQKQKYQPAEDMIGVSHIMKTSKQKIQLENTVGIKRLLKTSKERVEPVEDMFGISRLLRTPKEKYPPVDDFMGLQKLMAESKQKYPSSELDYVGVKEMFDTPKEIKVKVMDFMKENNSHIDPKNEHESRGNLERENLKQEKILEESLEKTSLPFIRSRNRNIKNEQELQGNFEKACISPKDLEIVKNIDSIEKEKMSDGSITESHNLLNSVISLTKTDPVQEPAMQLQKELKQYLKGSDYEEFLFKNPVAPQLNLIQESIDLSSKDKTSTRVKQQKIEIKECPSSYLRECEENLKENVSLLELPVLMKESIEEQKEEIVAFTSVVKNLERKESNSPCMEEDISKIHVLQQLDKNDAVPSVEINRALHSSRWSKSNLGSCNEDSLMPKTETTTMKQNLQTIQQSVTSRILIMENDQSIKIANVSNINKNVIGLVPPEDKSDQGSVENSEKVALSIRKRSRRDNKLEIVESLVPAKRTRRGKIKDNTQMSTEDYDAKEKSRRPATRNHCRAETAKCIQTHEQDCAKRIIEAAAVEESEINKLTLEIMITEKKGRKPLRVKSRKQLEETNNENAEMGPENVRNVQETKKTSNETVFKTHNSIKNETQAAQGNKEAEGGQSLKESYFENTNEAPINVYSLQINTNSIKKPNQLHENKRGKKDLLVINEGEFAKNEELVPQIISEIEPETIFTKDTSGSLQVGKDYKTQEARNSPTATMVYDLKDERTVLRRGKRIRKGEGKQEALETKQIEILENTPTVAHGTTLRRDREKKVHFELDQNKTSENIPFQANGNLLRRGRKKEVSLTSQVVSSTSLRKKYNLLEIDAKKETPKKDKAAASEYTVSSTKENPVRRGRRKQVDDKVLATSSTFFGGKCSLLEYSGKEEVSKDHSVPLETMVLHTKEKLSRRGKRNEVFLTARGASLRGESSLPEHDGKEDIPEEDQNVLLGNTAETKATPSRKSRRKQVALTTQATGCTSLREKSSLPENDKEVIPKEQNMSLGSTTSQEKANLSRNSRRKQVDLTAQGASSTSLRGKSRLLENNGKEEIPEDDQNVLLGNTAKTKATQSRKSQRKQVDLTTQETSCPSLRGKRSLPENDDKEEIPKDQNMSLESTASQEKTNPSRNSRRKQVGLIAQGASSTSLRGKSSLPENDGKEDIPEEDQNVLLGNTAEIKATPSRKSRRKQVDLTTQATSCTSHRGKSSLPENDDKGKVPAEDQNVPFKNITKTQANPSRKGRRKQVDLTTQATSCTSLRGESSLPENYGKEDIPEEDQNVFLGNTAEAKATPSRKSRRKQVDLTTQATSCTSPRGKNCLPEKNDKEKTLKDENVSFRNATETKANPFSKGRRKQAGLTTQAASCTSLKGKSLPEKEGKEKTPKENQNMPLGNITSQASKKGGRKQLDLTTQAASPTAIEGKSCMPKNDSKKKTSEEDQNVPLANTTLETKANPSRKGRGKQVELTSQAASSTSLRRKRHLPEDEETAKKLKAECGERITLQKETRNKSNRKLDKCGLNIQSVGGTERKTRASTRTRK